MGQHVNLLRLHMLQDQQLVPQVCLLTCARIAQKNVVHCVHHGLANAAATVMAVRASFITLQWAVYGLMLTA